jgi:hypothetical protein
MRDDIKNWIGRLRKDFLGPELSLLQSRFSNRSKMNKIERILLRKLRSHFYYGCQSLHSSNGNVETNP